MASGAQTCYISAGLYLIYPLIYLILYFKKNKFSCCKKQPKMIEDILLKDIEIKYPEEEKYQSETKYKERVNS